MAQAWLAGNARPLLLAGSMLTWFPAILFVRDNVLDVQQFTGSSMYPFINPDYHASTRSDLALISKREPWKGLERGMLIGFWMPSDPTRMAGKRIVALEGDEVTTRPPYPKPREVVPYGHVWVEGDNSHGSIDSNWYGPVSKNLITGKIQAVIWPHVHWINHKHYRGSSRVAVNKYPVEKPPLYT